MSPGGYHSFEHRWALATAVRLQQRIGLDRIAARIAMLSQALRDGLGRIGGVTVHAPAEPALRSGVVCCTVEGRPPQDVVRRLHDEHGIVATVTPYPRRARALRDDAPQHARGGRGRLQSRAGHRRGVASEA
jgi:selenocysteine lyase/cysteine desulfurase